MSNPITQSERVAMTFALKWFAAVNRSRSPDSFVTSPFAVQTAFALWYLGMNENAQKVATGVLIPGCSNDADVQMVRRTMIGVTKWWRRKSIHLANRLCAPATCLYSSCYRQRISAMFGGNQFLPVDFINNAPALIDATNRWTAAVTKGRVELLDSLSEQDDTGLLLVSGMFVDAKMLLLNAFNRFSTRYGEKFYSDQSMGCMCDMMCQTKELGYCEDEHCQVVRLAYDGDTEMGLYIFLPIKRYDLMEFEFNMTTEYMLDRLNNCARSRREVEVIMPKIKLSTEMRHGQTVEAMGRMKFEPMEIFERKTKAPSQNDCVFSKMVQTPKKGTETGVVAKKLQMTRRLWMSQMVHKTVFELEDTVNDTESIVSVSGTEEAKSTSMCGTNSFNKEMQPALVKADHPFLFLLAIDVPKISVAFGRFCGR